MLVDNGIRSWRTSTATCSRASLLDAVSDQSGLAGHHLTLTNWGFAPLMFWPGILGEFMFFLPETVIIVLTASLFVALVINPVPGV
jgi:hypothetical protein